MIRVRASQIFTPQVEDAVAAKKALDAGTPFTEVVAKYSTCPSREAGGDLGWMPEENAEGLLGQAISREDIGKILGPIHSPYGYHILKITEIELNLPEGPFTESTSMVEVNRKLPEAHTLLFKKFHIGLPVNGYRPEETIGSLARSHGKSPIELLALLNREYADKQVATIEPEALKAKLDAGDPNLRLLDIRERWEYDIARFPGAVFIHPENVEEVLKDLTPDHEIILIDWKGDRSPSFQKWLAQRGLHNAKGISGGIDAWAQRVDTRMARYEIDEEDDDYRYQDIFEGLT